MKPPMFLIAAAFLLSTLATRADIIAGDVIAVDLSTAGGAATHYNTFDAGGTITDGNVIRLSDGNVVTGLSLTFGAGGGYNNDGNAGNWPGTAADPFYVIAADDIWFGNANSLTFAGLDPGTYNVRIYSLISNNGGQTETFTVTDGAGTVDLVNSTRASRFSGATLEDGGTVFNGVSPNTSGNIVVTVDSNGTSNAFLNAITLEAVMIIPEPSSLGLFAGGLVLLAGLRRRARKT